LDLDSAGSLLVYFVGTGRALAGAAVFALRVSLCSLDESTCGAYVLELWLLVSHRVYLLSSEINGRLFPARQAYLTLFQGPCNEAELALHSYSTAPART
jgi:hypothetical protein